MEKLSLQGSLPIWNTPRALLYTPRNTHLGRSDVRAIRVLPLCALLCLLGTAGADDGSVVEIHEWGIVELGREFGAVSAYPGVYEVEEYFEPYPAAEVRAPVIWYHGAECTGTLTVQVNMSGFTTLIPRPDCVEEPLVAGRMGFGPFIATWRNLDIRDPEVAESIWGDRWYREDITPPVPDDLLFAFEAWRRVPCNVVHHPSSGHIDSFMYYETEMYDAGMFEGDWYGYSGEALVFFEESGGMACVRSPIPTMEGYGGERLTDQAVVDTINSWSTDMTHEEMLAFWATWEDYLEERCVEDEETLMLFPLSNDQVEAISRVTFTPDQDLEVVYTRLLMGLGTI